MKFFSMKSICVILTVLSLVLNVFIVAYKSLNFRNDMSNGNVAVTDKKYRNERSTLLGNIANHLINNSKSKNLVVAKKNSPDIFYDNYDFSDNSKFLFIHIRHKDNKFKIIFDPDIQIRDYDSDFRFALDLLELDSKISFDLETEKYIMGKVRENLIINNSFEHEKNMSLKYSNLSHSGDFSMVFSKTNYPESRSGHRPDFRLLTLEPGFYFFGGYYKSKNLNDTAMFEIVDCNGNSWHSNTVSGSTEWTLLKGNLYLKKKSKIILRPFLINNFLSGEVYVDDLFLIKF